MLYNTGEDFMYTMPIFKSGLLNEEANVALSVDSKLIEQYNKDNKTTSELLPAEYYQIVKANKPWILLQQKSKFPGGIQNQSPERESQPGSLYSAIVTDFRKEKCKRIKVKISFTSLLS